MKKKHIFLILGLSVVLAGAYWFFHEKGEKPSGEKMETSGQIASVKVVPIKKASVESIISAYGYIVPAPGAIYTVSPAYESRVNSIKVSAAQKISAGDVLTEIEPSPNTLLELKQAQNDYEISKRSLTHTQELFDLKFATNNQLLQARQTFDQAENHLESLKKRGVGGKQLIRSDITGLVNKVNVQEGAIIAAGNPLLEIVAQNRFEARIDMQPEDISRVRQNQDVQLTSVNIPNPPCITGKIRKISSTLNQDSHLVDVFVTLPESACFNFLLGEYILGKIKISSSYGMVVPRSSILPEDGNYFLFTVREDRAVKHKVDVGLENENEVAISSRDLSPGKKVVILGNYELKDGMTVKVDMSQ